MKLLVSDFDGTIFIHKRISKEDSEALKSWQSAGNMFGIASGRSLSMLKPYLADYDGPENACDPDFLVCLSGAAIYDRNGMLYKKTLGMDTVRRLLEGDVLSYTYHVIFCGAQKDYIMSGMPGSAILDEPFFEGRVSDVEEMASYTCAQDICQLSLAFENEQICARFAKRFNHFALTPVSAYPNGRCLDVVARGISKSTGIGLYAQRLEAWAQVYAIGDGENDLPMLLRYEGSTLNHAVAAVRDQVGEVCSSVAEYVQRHIGD